MSISLNLKIITMVTMTLITMMNKTNSNDDSNNKDNEINNNISCKAKATTTAKLRTMMITIIVMPLLISIMMCAEFLVLMYIYLLKSLFICLCRVGTVVRRVNESFWFTSNEP